MGSLVRSLLIWLLVLTVPAQGMAAVTMAFCGPGHAAAARVQHPSTVGAPHHHPTSHPTSHPASAGAGHHGPGAPAQSPPGHDHAAHQAVVVAAGGDGHAETAVAVDEGAAAPSGAHTCSVCASCCSVGALLQAVLTVPAPERGATTFAAEVPAVDPFAVAGPDRPPRLA